MIYIILIFGNVPDILLQHYSRISFNCHQWNVRSRVSVSVSNFQVSVSGIMTQSRSRSRLKIWARSRSRRLRSRLHHCFSYTSQHSCDKTMDGKMALYRECCFPNCTNLWWIKSLS